MIKSGGTLVYSTCSIMCEENECVIAWILQTYPEMELVPAEPMIGDPGLTVVSYKIYDSIKLSRSQINSQTIRVFRPI